MDVDGVLADFNTAYMLRIASCTGRNLFPPRYQPHTWDYPVTFGYSRSEIRRVWLNIGADPEFWSNLHPFAGTHAAMDELVLRSRWGSDVYFITARPGATTKDQTERWLRGACAGAMVPTVLLSSHKGLCATALSLDHYIDDRWENALEVATTKTKSYLLTQPWNTEYDAAPAGITRVATLADFFVALGPVTP